MSAYDVVWSGRGPLPGTGEYATRESYLLRAGREHGYSESEIDERSAKRPTRWCTKCGARMRLLSASRQLECATCRGKARRPGINDRPRCGCGGSITRNDWSAGVRRCGRCQMARRSLRRPDASVRASR